MDNTLQKMIYIIISLFLIFTGLGIFFRNTYIITVIFGTSDVMPFVKGLTFGTLFCLLKLLLMKKTFQKALDYPSHKAINYVRIHYLMRFFLTGAFLYVAITNESIDFFGAFVGLLQLQFASYIAGFLTKDTEQVT